MSALPILPVRTCTLHQRQAPFRCHRRCGAARVIAQASANSDADVDRRAALSGLAATALAIALPPAARAEVAEEKIKEVVAAHAAAAVILLMAMGAANGRD